MTEGFDGFSNRAEVPIEVVQFFIHIIEALVLLPRHFVQLRKHGFEST